MNRPPALRRPLAAMCLAGAALVTACFIDEPCALDGSCPTGMRCVVAGDRRACYSSDNATYSLGGTIAGVKRGGLVLASPGEPDLPVDPGATQFTFPTPFLPGSTYAVAVKTGPPAFACTVQNGIGTFDAVDVSNVAVQCTVVGHTGFVQPAGTVAVSFSVDATMRPGFYASQDLEWMGSFSYDAGTRILTPGTGWVGPFAGLWDDGPWTVNQGHEPKGSVAGDDKFGITVFVPIPSSDVTMKYGARTKEGGWIWVGNDGVVTLPANSSTEITADGLTLPPEGTIDVQLLIDTKALGGNGAFTETPTITVKGTMSGWAEDQASDDGTHGDAVARDHVYTYTLTSNGPRRRPKMTTGTRCEFVWVFHPVQPDGGVGWQEYKYGPNHGAGTGGVSAKTSNADAGWIGATIQQQTSDHYNTYIVIP